MQTDAHASLRIRLLRHGELSW